MKRIAVVQARMGSTRFPGKVVADLDGAPVLARVIERVQRSRSIDEVVVATSVVSADDEVAELARALGVRSIRGSEGDVLGRYALATVETRADVVVRVTADCPLVEPTVIDRVVSALLADGGRCDYASNVIERTYPKGLDVEALWSDVVRRADRLATSTLAREHVTWFIYRERPDLHVLRSVTAPEDDHDLRLTVDTTADLELVRRLYSWLDLSRSQVELADLIRHARLLRPHVDYH